MRANRRGLMSVGTVFLGLFLVLAGCGKQAEQQQDVETEPSAVATDIDRTAFPGDRETVTSPVITSPPTKIVVADPQRLIPHPTPVQPGASIERESAEPGSIAPESAVTREGPIPLHTRPMPSVESSDPRLTRRVFTPPASIRENPLRKPSSSVVEPSSTMRSPESGAIGLLPMTTGSPRPQAAEARMVAEPRGMVMETGERDASMPEETAPRPEAPVARSFSPAARTVTDIAAATGEVDVPAGRIDVEVAAANPDPPSADSGSDVSPPATSPATEEEEETDVGEADYEVVEVFYGTDRMSVGESVSPNQGYSGWLYSTAGCALITGLLLIGTFRSRNRVMLVLSATGIVATLLLGAVTGVHRLKSEPAHGPRPDMAYGNGRGELQMGVCEVSIPRHHEVGEIERPSILRLEFQEDPRLHVVLLDIEEQPADVFFSELRGRVQDSAKKEAFVFIHGYNVSFEEAAQRTAQLASDLDFDGAPIFFSWPSQGGLWQYAVDETNALWTVPHLKEFLVAVSRRSEAQSVHLIAHSMGNRALTSALESLSHEFQGESPMFRQVVLTAPDIDAEIFQRDIVPAILTTAGRITLYASSNDEALKLSKKVHGYRRAGDSGDLLLVIPGIDTVDVSSIDTSFLGHNYYGDNQTVIADMIDLVKESKPPHLRRWLLRRNMGQMVYWVFQANPAVIGVSQPPITEIRR